jgi:hypothetical protein
MPARLSAYMSKWLINNKYDDFENGFGDLEIKEIIKLMIKKETSYGI